MHGPSDEQDRWLSGPLPPDPLPRLAQWLDEALASEVQPLPEAMMLATVDPDGRPSARVVLCKGFDAELGTLTFYTNRRSRKGRAMEHDPRVAVVFHWNHLHRQAIVEGPVTEVPSEEADAYFESRPLDARLSAWASDQSEPVDSRERLCARMEELAERFGVSSGSGKVPRPLHWGGVRIHAERIELWVSRPGRVHDRAEWIRTLRTDSAGCKAGPWRPRRLQP